MMFIIKKLITPFILPPGLFVLMFLSGGILLVCRRYRKIGSAAIAVGLAMWLMSIAPVADMFLTNLTREIAVRSPYPQGDVIILLGGGVDDQLTDLSGAPGVLSDAMLARTVDAARLYARLKIPVIVSGGKPLDRKVAESAVARRYLQEMGIPGGAIIEENTSRDTFENARGVLKICKRRGFRAPILVTSDYHLKRALWAFRKVGLHCEPFANGMTQVPTRRYSWDHYLPGSLEPFSDCLHETIGLFYYRLVY